MTRPTEKLSNEEKAQYYLRLLREALIAIRLYSVEGEGELAASIANVMHNVPSLLLTPQTLQDDEWLYEKMHEMAQRDGWEMILEGWEARCLQEIQPLPA